MRTMFWLALAAGLALFSGEAGAQRRDGPEGQRPMYPERVEKFRKLRMIETLKLGEEASVRFFAKQSAHEDAVRDLMQQRDDLLDGMEKAMDDGKADGKDLLRQADRAMELEGKIFAERQRFKSEVREMLTPEQFAKFILFERNFGRQVRGALQEMRGHQRRDRQE